jgi:hypothetical protein
MGAAALRALGRVLARVYLTLVHDFYVLSNFLAIYLQAGWIGQWCNEPHSQRPATEGRKGCALSISHREYMGEIV